MDIDELKACLRRLGLVEADESIRATPLSGGVSSDIILIEPKGGAFV